MAAFKTLIEEITEILPTLEHRELQKIRAALQSPKEKIIQQIDWQLPFLEQAELEEIELLIRTKRVTKIREIFKDLQEDPSTPEENAAFEKAIRQPGFSRYPRNEEELQELIQQARQYIAEFYSDEQKDVRK